MRTLTHLIEYTDSYSPYTIWYLTDTHSGARAADDSLLKQHIQAIEQDPNARWIFGGDAIDAIARKNDKRYEESNYAEWLRGEKDAIGAQRDCWLNLFKPIAAKCLGIVCGNHESYVLHKHDRDIYSELVKGVAGLAGAEPSSLALGIQGFIVLRFQWKHPKSSGHLYRQTWYCHHGYGGGQLPGSHALALGRVMGTYEADIYAMGHRHVRIMIEQMRARPSPSQGAILENKLAMFVPSYLNAFIIPSKNELSVDTYAEEKGLRAQPLGCTPVVVYPADRRYVYVHSSDGSFDRNLIGRYDKNRLTAPTD